MRKDPDPSSLSGVSVAQHGQFLGSVNDGVSYRYQEIGAEDFIRLIELGKDITTDTVRFQLLAVALEDPPVYEAVSYVWGSPERVATIWCGGKAMRVTQSVYDVLTRFRHREETRLIWLDAVCINQDDVEEKSAQVRRMSRIYSLAKRVLVWLGPEKDGSRLALQYFKDLSRRCCEASSASTSELLRIRSYDFGPTYEEFPSAEDTIWSFVVEFFARPYFNRVWIIQEVLSARAVVAFCGDAELNWEELLVSVRWIIHRSMEKNGLQVYPRFKGKGSYHASMLDRAKFERYGLLNLLCFAKEFAASDPRDKIYALADLCATACGHDEFPIEPDYRLSWQETFRNFSRRFIEFSGSLDVLSTVWHYRPPDSRSDHMVPTWVTCWDEFRENGAFARGWTRASGDKPLTLGGDSLDPNVLRLDGLIVDVVERVFPSPARRGGFWKIDPAAVTESLLLEADNNPSWASMFEDKKSYVTGEDLVTAYAYTITRGENHEYVGVVGEEMLAQHRADFAAVLMKWAEVNQGHAYKGIPMGDISAQSAISKEAKRGSVERFNVASARGWASFHFFVTSTGYMGLGGQFIRKGDICVVLFGGSVPFILRPEGNGRYLLVGECLVRGLMQGESIERWENGQQLERRTFDIC